MGPDAPPTPNWTTRPRAVVKALHDTKFAHFLANQALRPLFMVLVLAVAARLSTNREFGTFLQAYAVADLLSIVTDLGQRQALFGSIRRAWTGDATAIAEDVRGALRHKAIASGVLTAAAFLFSVVMSLDLRLSAAVVASAVVVPAGDIALTTLRAVNRPGTETLLVAGEQILVLATIVAAAELAGATALAYMTAMAVVGWMRFLAGMVYLRPYMARGSTLDNSTATPRPPVAVFGSIFAAALYARLPALAFSPVLSPRQFAVFVGIWTMVARAQLILNALLLSTYGRQDGGRWTRPGFLAGAAFGMGTLVAGTFALIPEQLVSLFLGDQLAGAATMAWLAALVTVASYPEFVVRNLLNYESGSWVPVVTALIGGGVVVASVALNASAVTVASYVAGYALSFVWIGVALRRRRRSTAGRTQPVLTGSAD